MQSRRELEFLEQQAALLASNSVSLTQITKPNTNNNNNKNNNLTNIQVIPNNIQAPTSPASANTNLSKYSQLLNVIEEMGKDIR